MAKITLFKAGYCTHLACIAIRGAQAKTCQFPAQTALIEAHGRYWLWDTGYANHFFDATRICVYALYPKVTPVYFDSNESMLAQLQAQGLRPQDLSGMILSHFHGDHIAGAKDFAQTPFICSNEGWRKMRPLKGISAVRKGYIPELLPPDFANQTQFIEQFLQINLPAELAPFTQGYVLPNSQQEVIFVPLPGHAAGQIGAFVQTDDGWVLLAADAAWSKANFQGKPPSRLAHLLMDDTRAFYQTLEKLATLHRNGVPIILSHEPPNGSILDSIR